MILQDIKGNKVNAERFEIKIVKGMEEEPVAILHGIYSYFKNLGLLSPYIVNDTSVLDYKPATIANLSLLLAKVDDLESNQIEIDKKVEELYRDYGDLKNKTEDAMCKKQEIKFENGFAFFMPEEYLNRNHQTQQEMKLSKKSKGR